MEEFTIGNPAIQAVEEGKSSKRQRKDFENMVVLVGGNPFIQRPNLRKSCYGIQKQSV